MPNIWHLAHQILLFKLYEVCYMFYNFRTCYSTVSNMRRYGHKCHFRKIIFYSTFSLTSQYLIQCFLSPSTSLALSVLAGLSVYISCSLCSGPFAIADLAIADLAMPILPRREAETARLATDHDPLCDEEELQCKGHGGRK